MVGYNTPVPAYSVTGGGYWPQDKGTIPMPVPFDDDGSTYVVVTVTGAGVGHTATSLKFGQTVLLSTPVALTSGDDDQSAADIAAQVTIDTGGQWIAGPPANGTVVLHWDGYAYPKLPPIASGTAAFGAGALSFSAASSVMAVATRWVITPAEDHAVFPTDRAYLIMDALDPGVNTLSPVTPTYPNPIQVQPSTGDPRTQPPITSLKGAWVYCPSTHAMRKVIDEDRRGDDTRWLVIIAGDEFPGLPYGSYLPILAVSGAAGAPKVENTGAGTALIGGQQLPQGISWGRDNSAQVPSAVTYEAALTTLSITVNT